MSFVGIDVSKTQLDIAERPGNKRWSAVNAEADIGKVVETVGALSPQVIEMLTAEKNRLGISPKVALTACMRKLLVSLNAIMKNRIPWQADYSTCPTPQIP
jgi:hypothetical protein